MTPRRLSAIGVFVTCALLVGIRVTAFAGQDDSPPEHPVIKPMTGATPTAESSVDDFGRLVVGYRGGIRCRARSGRGTLLASLLPIGRP